LRRGLQRHQIPGGPHGSLSREFENVYFIKIKFHQKKVINKKIKEKEKLVVHLKSFGTKPFSR